MPFSVARCPVPKTPPFKGGAEVFLAADRNNDCWGYLSVHNLHVLTGIPKQNLYNLLGNLLQNDDDFSPLFTGKGKKPKKFIEVRRIFFFCSKTKTPHTFSKLGAFKLVMHKLKGKDGWEDVDMDVAFKILTDLIEAQMKTQDMTRDWKLCVSDGEEILSISEEEAGDVLNNMKPSLARKRPADDSVEKLSAQIKGLTNMVSGLTDMVSALPLAIAVEGHKGNDEFEVAFDAAVSSEVHKMRPKIEDELTAQLTAKLEARSEEMLAGLMAEKRQKIDQELAAASGRVQELEQQAKEIEQQLFDGQEEYIAKTAKLDQKIAAQEQTIAAQEEKIAAQEEFLATIKKRLRRTRMQGAKDAQKRKKMSNDEVVDAAVKKATSEM